MDDPDQNEQPSEPILFPPYKELVKAGMNWEYGSTHTHEEYSEIMGIPYPSTKYYEQAIRANFELADLGRRVKCINGVGYRVLLPEEYPEAAYDDAHKSGKAMKLGLDYIHCAPVHTMDDNLRKKMEQIGSHMARTYVSLVSSVTEVKELAGIKRPQKMLGKGANKEEQ